MLQSGKGTRDIVGKDLISYNFIVNTLKENFKLNDAKEINTPVIERLDTVKELYGEGFNREVFELSSAKDEAKEFLRYDLTLPFGRYCASKDIMRFKRSIQCTRSVRPIFSIYMTNEFLQGLSNTSEAWNDYCKLTDLNVHKAF